MLPTKISDNELAKTLVSRLPLRPASESKYRTSPMTGEEIRDAFDASARLLTEKFNALIDFLTDTSAGSGIAELPYSAAITLGQTLEELGEMLDSLETNLQEFDRENKRAMAELEVKTFGNITSLDLKTENRLMAVEGSVNEVKRLSESTKNAASASAAAADSAQAIMQEMKTAFESVQKDIETTSEKTDGAQIRLENLSALMNAFEKALEKTDALAQNAVQQVDSQGLYAHDYDSKTGLLVERLMLYSPTASPTFKSSWRIAQRDADGCLQGQAPQKDYQLTPKFYVEENFAKRMNGRTEEVKGRKEITEWEEGVHYEFGNGGEPTFDDTMKAYNADGFFSENEEVVFYADGDGVSVIDIYHGQQPLLYDTQSGRYKLVFRQKLFERPDLSLYSCRVNAPSGVRVYYDSRGVSDSAALSLKPATDYELCGSGRKTLSLGLPENYYAHDANQVCVRFSSNAVQVLFESQVPIYFCGDLCENGQMKNLFGYRYHLTLSFDGVGYLCRVTAYRLPTPEVSE